MPASVTRLLDNLEARLEQAHAELATLRDENRRLQQRLAQTPPLAQEPKAESTQKSTQTDIQEGVQTVEVTATEKDHHPAPAAESDPVREAPSPQALLKQWYARYPQAFLTGHTQPLKVGIHEDLARQEPWSNKLIRRALAHYVNLPRYVKALREGAPRIDLDGNPVGVVDATAAQAAVEKRRRQASNKAGAGTQSAGKGRTEKQKAENNKPRRPRKPKAEQPETPVGKGSDGTMPQREEKPRQPAQSMEDKLASLQRRFGRGDS